jgi:hypothetical protein
MKTRCYISHLLIGCFLVELAIFLWLCSLDRVVFAEFVTSPDSGTYASVARDIVRDGVLVPSPRTLGYPLFLALGYLIGGLTYGSYVVIGFQLILNLIFTYCCWGLLEKLTPNMEINLRTFATLFCFCAGMGMALDLLSDFLAAVFFCIFFYGLLFWRSRSCVLLSAIALALATLTRPTFTFIPLLLPVAAYLTQRTTARISWSHIVVFAAASIAATSVSVGYQYFSYGHLGPSSIMAKNIGRTLHYSFVGTYPFDYEKFQRKVAEDAGKSLAMLPPREEEKQSVRLLLKEFMAHPPEILLQFAITFLKYLFVPVESVIAKWVSLYIDEQTYSVHVRPVLGLLCLPVWVLSLFPPRGATRMSMPYYLLVMLFLIYILGVTIINPLQGERIRFPVLVFLMPIMLWNLQGLLYPRPWVEKDSPA